MQKPKKPIRPKLHFQQPNDGWIPNRYVGWKPKFPDQDVPLKIVFSVPGDRSEFNEETKKLHLDTRIVELEYVLVEVKRNSKGMLTDAHYLLSTSQNPLTPINPLLD